MFAKIIKLSSPLVNLRQLFRLNINASSLNSLEQGPPLEPREQQQPLRGNFFALLIISFRFSSLFIISMSAIVCHFRKMHASKSIICCHGNYAFAGERPIIHILIACFALCRRYCFVISVRLPFCVITNNLAGLKCL